MGVKIISRKYNEIYSDTPTDWLLGNVGDWQKVLIEVEAGVELLATQQSPLQIDYVNNAIVLSGGDSWGQLGFDAGMAITMTYKKSIDSNGDGTLDQVQTISNNYTINNIYGNVMEVEEPLEVDGFENIPTNFGTKKISDVILTANVEIEGCKLRYGHIPNDDRSGNLRSVIDSTITEFILPQLNSVNQGSWANMEAIGMQSGMSVQRARLRSLSGSQENLLTTINDGLNATNDFVGIVRDVFSISYVNYRSIGLVPSDLTGNLMISISQIIVPDPPNITAAFLYNADASFQQQYLVNIDVRITNVENIVPSDSLQLVLIKYTNGNDMTFVEKTTIQSWSNAQSLINENLNHTGLIDVNINQSDSLILAMEYVKSPDNGYNNVGTQNGIFYKIENVFIQVGRRNQAISAGSKKTYQIEIDYMLSSLFDNLENLQNLEMPGYLTGDGSLTDNFLIKFFPEWNNPNVMIQNEPKQTKRLGNTGWFNENFNQLNNDFTVESVGYFDEDGNAIESIDYSKPTKVRALISGVPNINSDSEFGYGFAWVPTNPDDYKNKETPFHQNTFNVRGSSFGGLGANSTSGTFIGSGVDGGMMQSKFARFSEQNGDIVFEITLVPYGNFSSIFEGKPKDDRNFVIWVSLADGSLPRQFSDRVSLIVDVNNMVKSVPPVGAYPKVSARFMEHPFNANVEGVETYKGITQDDVLCRMPFTIEKNGPEFQKITFGVEAHPIEGSVSTNPSFELERFEVDVSQYPTVDEVQQFDYNSIRGFKLDNGNNKNWVKVNRTPELDTNQENGYTAFYAFKLRYEDWLQKVDVPNEFFDKTELNNGLNHDWFHYLNTDGWGVYFFSIIEAVVNGELVKYKNTYRIEFKDYDQNENVDTAIRYYRQSDNTLLNVPAILTNEPTRIEIDFQITDDGIWNPNSNYAVTTIEIDKGAGAFSMRQLSSVWGRENDNPLKPIDGETKLKISIDGTAKILTTSCVVDPELLEKGSTYRITGRVGCFEFENNQEVDLGLYENRYEETYE